jgi:hypothetical protein
VLSTVESTLAVPCNLQPDQIAHFEGILGNAWQLYNRFPTAVRFQSIFCAGDLRIYLLRFFGIRATAFTE